MSILDFFKKPEPKFQVYNLMVVDDDIELIESLSLIKLPKDINVVFVTSAYDAISQLRTGAFDAVLADINMPNMDYLNQELKTRASEIPVYRMSGQYDQFMNLMLKKPFSKEQFINALLDLKGLSSSIKAA